MIPPAETERPAAPPFDLVVFDLDGTLIDAAGGRGHQRVRGAGEVLAALRARGAKLALASLCGRGFLALGLDRLGLRAAVDDARCLDDPGCSDKAAMVADLLLQFGTRSCLVVGDSPGDGVAAAENGLPFVHFVGTGAAPGAVPWADATLDRLTDLPRLLERRPRRLRELFAELGEPAGLAVVGPLGADADLVARDLVRALAAVGVAAVAVPRAALPGEPTEAAERDRLATALGGDAEVVVAHGPAAAAGWPEGGPDAILALAASPAALHTRAAAAAAVGGPDAQRTARERCDREAAFVARALAARPADRTVEATAALALRGV